MISQRKVQFENEYEIPAYDFSSREGEVVCRFCSRIFSDAKKLARHIEIAGLSDFDKGPT
jgi:uncharacterized C2H2 Zn-finger protein